MLDPFVVSIVSGLFVGVVLAVTGAGGSILSLPLLVFAFDLNMTSAAPIALLAVVLSTSVATVLGFKNGMVRYKAAILLSGCGMLLAPAGVWFAQRLSDQVLAVLFTLVLLMVAVCSLHFATNDYLENPDISQNSVSVACKVNLASRKISWTASCAQMLVLTGGLTGFLSGLLGIGGGFIIVPALHKVSNLESRTIVATSLAVVAIVSTVSLLSYTGHVPINWYIALPFISGNLIGMLFGRVLAVNIASQTSQRILGLLACSTAIVFMIRLLISFY